jgi:hypothetical protein
MRRAFRTILAMTVGAGFAATSVAWASTAPQTFQLASYSTTERPEAVRECLLTLVSESRWSGPGRGPNKAVESPAVDGLWEIEFLYRGVPTRIVVQQTSIRGARVTYPVALALNSPADRDTGYDGSVEACG